MTQRIVNLPTNNFGRFGLNTQESDTDLGPEWLTEAQNVLIDRQGKLGVRSGSKQLHADALGADAVTSFYFKNDTGEIHVVTTETAIFKVVSGVVTDITSATTPTAGNWKFEVFKEKLIGVQAGHTPIILNTIGGSFVDMVATAGTVPTGTDVMSAYGRVWMIDGDTLHWSDVLLELVWSGGTSGSQELAYVWEGGRDTAEALTEWDGRIVVMGREQIVLYTGAETGDPNANQQKERVISGSGCIARDSVVKYADDCFFLSLSGVRSLNREFEGRQQTNDVSRSVYDYLMEGYSAANKDLVKAAWANDIKSYVILVGSRVMIFDTKMGFEDGSYRATEWTVDEDTDAITCFSTDEDALFIGSGQYLSQYIGRRDGVSSAGANGNSYAWVATSPWFDWGNIDPSVANRLKILKNAKVRLFGGAGYTIKLKWALDWDVTFSDVNIVIPPATNSLWGVSEWGTAEYGGSELFHNVRRGLRKSGESIKLSVTTNINGESFALQRVDVQAKLGKVIL